MGSFFWATVLVSLLAVVNISQNHPLLSNAQSTPAPAPAPSARALDVLLQDYAYRAFVRPRTGSVYTAQVPSNFSGITLSVVRLRSGSLRNRGLQYNEFNLPMGVVVMPYVLRLALVYQNLGNWSKAYYGVPGYTLVTPIVGLLAYSAADLTATGLPELGLSLTGNPISVSLADLSSVPVTGQRSIPPMCVHFPLNGSYRIAGLVSGNLCTATEQGHFALVVNSSIAPAPSPGPSILPPSPSPPSPPAPKGEKKGESKVWKIAAAVVGGFLGLILLALLLLWLRRYRRKKTMTEMVKQSEAGEVLKAQRVGNAQLPVAPMVRTRPALENDYVP